MVFGYPSGIIDLVSEKNESGRWKTYVIIANPLNIVPSNNIQYAALPELRR